MQMRVVRLSAGLSQEALAHLAGLDRTYIGGIERSERNVSIDNIEKIANALKVDVALLLSPP
jgi:transcriptional regulator with XRE-family HTH domain